MGVRPGSMRAARCAQTGQPPRMICLPSVSLQRLGTARLAVGLNRPQLQCPHCNVRRRRLFWQRMTTPHGTRYWWSHLLGRASLDVPAQGWGGWCAEEMGLGKVRGGCVAACMWSSPFAAQPSRLSSAACRQLGGPVAVWLV